jgi:t-SNARE complex subunit (syntaxin)
VQLAVLEETESYVQERDGEIRNIVKSIEELSTIFKELAVLVIDQVSTSAVLLPDADAVHCTQGVACSPGLLLLLQR